MKKSKHVTIYDVAAACGLSKGTVDRVIHNRGRVSEESRQKVLKTIKELGWKPDEYAQILGTRTKYNIVCIMPQWRAGDYWGKIKEGFLEEAKVVERYGITVEILPYIDGNKESFNNACKSALDAKPHGIVIRPLYPEELSIDFINSLKKLSIPYAYVDNLLVNDKDYLTYYGVDFAKSGRLGAYLLTEGCKSPGDILIIRIIRGEGVVSDPTKVRRENFVEYIHDRYPDTNIYYIKIDPDHTTEAYELLDSFFHEHPEVRNVAMLNSRIFLMASYIKKRKLKDFRLIGYDNTTANLEALESGAVTYLITRHTSQQASLCIKAMTEFLLHQNLPAQRDNYMHMNVLTKYNLENFW